MADETAAAPAGKPETLIEPTPVDQVTDAALAAVPTDDNEGATFDEVAPDDSNQTGGEVL